MTGEAVAAHPVPELPYLAPWYRIARAPGKVLLEHAQRIVCLEGRAAERLVPALLPLLDGTRTVDEIVAVLGPPVRPAVEQALETLAAHAVLIDGPPPAEREPRPFAGAAELLASLHPRLRPLAETFEAVRGCTVGIAGEAPVGAEVARLLRSSAVEVERVEGPAPDVDLTVCAAAPAELPRLSEWNEQALSAASPWLQLLPFDGRYAAVGPLYLPGDTCCYECFRRRRAANIEAGDELAVVENAPAAYPAAPALDAFAGGLAAQLALAWLVLGDHYAPAAFYALELLPAISLSVHHVHRVPRCPACSEVADVAPPLPWHKELSLVRG